MKINTWLSVIIDRRRNIHQAVYDALGKSKVNSDWYNAEAGKDRVVQMYRCSKSDKIAIRFSKQPPEGFPSILMTHEINKGDKVVINIVLPSALREPKVYNPKKGLAYVMDAQDREEMIRRAMKRIGIEPSFLKHYATDPIKIFSSKGFGCSKPALEATIEGVVVDEELFAQGVLHGVGRFRGFGFGLVRFTKLEK